QWIAEGRTSCQQRGRSRRGRSPHFEFSDWRCLLNGMRDSIPPTAPAPTTPHEVGPQYFGAIQEARRSRSRAQMAPMIARERKSEIRLPALYSSLSANPKLTWMTQKTTTTTTAMRKISQSSRPQYIAKALFQSPHASPFDHGQKAKLSTRHALPTIHQDRLY